MNREAKIVGVVFTVAFHLLLALLSLKAQLREIPPLSEELELFIELESEPPKPIEVSSREPVRSRTPSPQEQLAQRAQSPIEGRGENRGEEATIGEEGDVEQFEPPRPVEIERRALFPSAANRDSVAPQRAEEATQEVIAGHAEGNTREGATDSTPQAKLSGRSVMGSLPIPEYRVNKSGRVVVKIFVDQHGKVVRTTPGAPGTTVQDRTLWDAASKAAAKAQFNVSTNAPALQEGTITYIFRLR